MGSPHELASAIATMRRFTSRTFSNSTGYSKLLSPPKIRGQDSASENKKTGAAEIHNAPPSLRRCQIDVHRLRILPADVPGIVEYPYAYGVRTGAANADASSGGRRAAHRTAVYPVEYLVDAAACIAGSDFDQYRRTVVHSVGVRRGRKAQTRGRRREVDGSGRGQEEDAADGVQGQTHVATRDSVGGTADSILQQCAVAQLSG